jgi:hypothetical protein
MNASYETMKTGAGNVSPGLEAGQSQGAAEVHAIVQDNAPVPVNAPAPNATGPMPGPAANPPSIPPESLAHAGGVHGLYDALSLHPGVWFLFGCIFIVFLLIVREIYYKKKAK